MFCVRHNTQGKLDKYKCSSYFLTVPKLINKDSDSIKHVLYELDKGKISDYSFEYLELIKDIAYYFI